LGFNRFLIGSVPLKLILKHKTKPNWLLVGFFGISLWIHIGVLYKITGNYLSKNISYIELDLKSELKPTARSIPRPRIRKTFIKPPEDIKNITLNPRILKKFIPLKIEALKGNFSPSLMEAIGNPETSKTDIFAEAEWAQPFGEKANEYLTGNEYFDMVRFRIERFKKYPSTAKAQQIEGVAILRFVIEPNGNAGSVKIIKSSKNRSLDQAAIRAVTDASPFPKIPKKLSTEPVLIEVRILFELT